MSILDRENEKSGVEKKPQKAERDYGKWVRRVIMLICIVVFAFSSFKVANILMDYKEAKDVYAGTADKYAQIFERHVLPTVNFEELKAINDDVAGWIFMENHVINYPVMRSNSRDEYLSKTMYGEPLVAGSIFFDYRCDSTLANKSTVIYGHRMRDNSMFGSLGKFSDLEHKEANKYIYILLPDGTYEKYEIFSFFVVSVYDPVYNLPTDSDEKFEAVVNSINSQNTYPDSYQATVDDKIINLSTCTLDSDDYRRVLVSARLVEKSPITYQ